MSLTSGQNSESETYDAVVVGASFAGLSFARGAAARGVRVLVVERDADIGAVVRTTGVLFSDVLDIADVPPRYLMNSVRRVQIRPPNQPPIEIGAQAFRFYMADVPGMLRWMAEQAKAQGVTIRCGTPFLDATPTRGGWMRVTFGGASESDGNGTATRTPRGAALGRIVIGADGARSAVARRLGLDQNTHFLAGAEWLVEGVPLDGETFYLVMDHQVAPGYCAWLAPHGAIAAFGVAGHLREFKPAESLRLAEAAFQGIADLSQMRVVERKAGVIPVGGRLKRVHRDDAKGRALLLGDAAGLCGAATGGGIYPALISGRLAAHAVANELLNGIPGAIRKYQRDLPQAARLGHYLQIEDWLRWVLDRMDSNADVAALYGLLGSGEGKRVLQSALLETPIIGMDSGFFSLLRSLLSKHPSVYGSAIRMAWQRVTTRA
ncbi:MAG: FAD-dependent monooxygenase [Ktedonobacterales bacterium]